MLPLRLPVSAGALFLALVSATAHLAAQSVLTISPQQCVWRAGDNPAWAAPNLDESGWQPYAQWNPQPYQPHLWVRCHADLSILRSVTSPALQVRLYAAYEIYLNGRRIGAAGNLQTGNFSMNAMRSFPVAGNQLGSEPSTIALRITRRSLISNGSQMVSSLPANAEIRAGDASILDALRAGVVLAQSGPYTDIAICHGMIAVIAVMLLGLFFYDRSRIELLLLAIVCLGLAVLRLDEFCIASLASYSLSTCLWMVLVAHVVSISAEIPFFFALAGRRMPLIFWILVGAAICPNLEGLFDLLLGIHQPAWFGVFSSSVVITFVMAVMAVLCISPFVAFWPYSRIAPRVRPLAALCMLWQAADLVWYALVAANSGVLGLPNLLAHWGVVVLEVRAFTTAGVLAALLGLLFREQRQVTADRAMLAGEIRAARAVQQVIIPDAIPSVPGFAIESVYKPAGEVGGDFFQILPTPAGGVLIVIGDVSGKGMPAAMTVSLLVGTVRTLAHYTRSPGEILAAMNQRMLARSNGGFTTCLVLSADPDGRLTAANAGHLAPYLNGEEMKLENGLPLGLASDTSYNESAFTLAPGVRLTLLTDGVAEARNAAGELFGFERTAAISTQPAESIARAAQQFGQDDDITVLTLSRLPVASNAALATALPALASSAVKP